MRKVKTLVALAITFVLLIGTHVLAATVPNDTVVIGNKAYSIAYLVKASADEINAQLQTLTDPQNQIIYRLGEMGSWKYLFTEKDANQDALKAWGTVDYYDADGKVTKLTFVEQQQKIVTAISAVDATNVKVTFVDGAAVTDASLAGKTITLTADKAVVATYKAASLDKGVATFVLGGTDKLTDAATYTAAADWTDLSGINFVAKVAAPYVKSFAKVSEVLADKVNLNVNIKALDQYGNDIAVTAANTAGVTVAATLNGMPLSGAEVTYAPGQSKFVVVNKLVEKDNLVVTFKDAKGNVIGQPLSYTVIKGDAPVVTVFTVKADKLQIASKETYTVTVNAIDQYNYPVEIGAADIRWVVNGTIAPETGSTLTRTPTVPGTYKVEAYYVKNARMNGSVTVAVGAANLTTLTVTGLNPATTYNQEDIKLAKISGDEGAILTPDMIKYNVLANTKDTTANDIVVTIALKGGEGADKNDIILTAKTLKAGQYTITPYVGAAIDDAKVVKGTAINVTTTLNPTITAIDDIDFGAKLKTGAQISKSVVVRNTHGEVVPFNGGVVTVATVPAAPVMTSAFAVVDGKDVLNLQANAEGTYQVNLLLNNKIYKTYTLNFATPKLTTIEAGADVTGVVAGDVDADAQYRVVKFFDQDGIAMPFSALTATVTNAKNEKVEPASNLVTFANVNFDKDGKLVVDNNSYAIKVLPAAALPEGVYTVKVANADGKVTDTLNVTVGAARVAKTMTADVTTVTLPINAKQIVKINVLDQYGKPINTAVAVASSNINVVTATDAAQLLDSKAQPVKGSYLVELTAKAQGTADVTYTVTVGQTTITAKTTVTVKTAGALINSVAIDDKAGYEKALFYTQDPAGVQLSATTYDVNGKEVVADSLAWSVASVKDAAGKDLPLNTVSVVDGLVKATSYKGTAVIKVTTTNFKTDTITLSFDNAAPAYVAGTLKATMKDAEDNDVAVPAAIVFNKDQNANVVITLAGLDQYGNEFTAIDPVLTTDDANIIGVTNVHNVITVAAKAPGTANLYIKVGEDVKAVQFTVDENTFEAKASVLNAFQIAAGSYANIDMDYKNAELRASNVQANVKLVDAVSIAKLVKIFAERNLNISKITIDGHAYTVNDVEAIRTAIAALAGKANINDVLLTDLHLRSIEITIDNVDYTLIG